jgi:mono/diheme cytochrome c family protein
MQSRTVASTAALLLFAASAGWAADGAEIYRSQCAKCHGESGKADTPVAQAMKVPPLAGDAKVQKMTADEIVAGIKGNAKHPPTIKSMGDADLAAAAAYAKQLAGAK